MHDMHFRGVDLNLLVVLDALLAERSVTRAAARLGLTQPATSHALRRLRALFGDPILVRGSAGMVPTPRAEALAGGVRRGLIELHRAVRGESRFEPGRSSRQFSIATVDHPLLTGLPRLLERASREAPGIGLSVVPFAGVLARRLELGEIDLVIAGAEAEAILALDTDLMRALAISETFVCVARADHPALADKRLDAATYAALPHLLVSTTGTGPGIVDGVLSRHGLRRRIAVRIPYFAGAALMLARSDLIATLPKAIAEEACRTAPLAMHRPPITLPRSDAYLWWHSRFQHDPAHVWLRSAVLDAFAPYRG